MSFYAATLLILFLTYRQMRKKPLRSYAKLQRSIGLYERQATQIMAVKTRMQAVPPTLTEQTLSAMEQRRNDLQRYIEDQWGQYQALYERPIYRHIFSLPSPPEFKC